MQRPSICVWTNHVLMWCPLLCRASTRPAPQNKETHKHMHLIPRRSSYSHKLQSFPRSKPHEHMRLVHQPRKPDKSSQPHRPRHLACWFFRHRGKNWIWKKHSLGITTGLCSGVRSVTVRSGSLQHQAPGLCSGRREPRDSCGREGQLREVQNGRRATKK